MAVAADSHCDFLIPARRLSCARQHDLSHDALCLFFCFCQYSTVCRNLQEKKDHSRKLSTRIFTRIRLSVPIGSFRSVFFYFSRIFSPQNQYFITRVVLTRKIPRAIIQLNKGTFYKIRKDNERRNCRKNTNSGCFV